MRERSYGAVGIRCLIAWVVGLGSGGGRPTRWGRNTCCSASSTASTSRCGRFNEALGDLSFDRAAIIVRALALGIYVTFVVLALGVIRRGGSAKAALLWVSVLFLMLIGGIGHDDGEQHRAGRWRSRWLASARSR